MPKSTQEFKIEAGKRTVRESRLYRYVENSPTYFIEILRGIVLRGAGFFDLIGQVAGLSICIVVILTLSIMRFHQQLG